MAIYSVIVRSFGDIFRSLNLNLRTKILLLVNFLS